MIKSVPQVSFKGYVPVTYYAKNPENGKFVPVVKSENMRKCQSFVVRNLNGTAKSMKNDDFVSLFRQYDSDYRRNPVVHSVYDKDKPVVYLVTGNDVATIQEMGKSVGIAKRESIDKVGHSKSFEAKSASRDYFRNVKSFLDRGCRRLRSADNNKLSLQVFFEPQYNRKNNFTGFNYLGAKFVEEK